MRKRKPKNKKEAPFGDFSKIQNFKVNPEDIEREIERYKQFEKYGIQTGFDHTNTPDECEAILYIIDGKELPKDLEERLLAAKAEQEKIKKDAMKKGGNGRLFGSNKQEKRDE